MRFHRSIVALTACLGCSSAPPMPELGTPDLEAREAVRAPEVRDAPEAPKPDAIEDPCVSSQDIRLELLAEQAAPSAEVRVGLHNVGPVPACVYTHIATHEWQHDWLSIEIVQGGTTRSLEFNDNRGKSAPQLAVLAPGQTDWQEVDVVAWARRPRNGGVPLAKGTYDARVIYDSSREDRAWAGTLETSLRLRVR